jgi:hypothetical protein
MTPEHISLFADYEYLLDDEHLLAERPDPVLE